MCRNRSILVLLIKFGSWLKYNLYPIFLTGFMISMSHLIWNSKPLLFVSYSNIQLLFSTHCIFAIRRRLRQNIRSLITIRHHYELSFSRQRDSIDFWRVVNQFIPETLRRRGLLRNHYSYGIWGWTLVKGVILPHLKHEWVIIKARIKLYLTGNPEMFLSNKHGWVVKKDATHYMWSIATVKMAGR